MPTVLVTLAFAATAGVVDARRSVASRGVAGSRGFLANDMQPDQVARRFVLVENDWRAQASMFADCSNSTEGNDDVVVDCHAAPVAFAASCNTVVQSAVSGSAGDRNAVREYLNDVCGQQVIKGWRAERCHELALGIVGSMTADSYENRVKFDSTGVCSRFWTQFLVVEKQRVEQEQLERERGAKAAEQERKAAEEAAEKKAEQERTAAAAEAEKKAEQEKQAAEAAAKKTEEEQKAAEEAAAKKAEEEQKAAEEAAAKKKEEERKAADVEKKVEEHKAQETNNAAVVIANSTSAEKASAVQPVAKNTTAAKA
eukprot:TRINITY_DN296_c0_g1_i1.p1 TRINITY_DN296_c0_g1~~TRINITY_DN296_c0_g1_i1.p1  ORF type:complete len:337 (-),score=100.77 TRINITY_DN296_c0_g1_i1:231-1169(-)